MFKSNIARTVFAQALVFLANLLMGFLLTPYLLSGIGAEAYAFYPLSFNIINYASVLTVIFTAMLSKYITVDYHKGDFTRVNEFFNSSICGNVIIGAVVGIPMLIGSFFVDSIFYVPESMAFEVKVLFMAVTVAFFVIQIRNTFMVANICTDRRYLTNIQKFIEKMLIVIFSLILFEVAEPSVIHLGISVLGAVLIRLFITVKTQRKIMPQLKVSEKYISRKVTKIIILSGLWYAFNQLITILNTNVEILIANLVFGHEVQSEYSIATLIPNLVRSMTVYINNLILPFLALLFKNESYEKLKKSIPGFMKCMSLFMAVIIALIIGFGDVFLKLWIPDFYSGSMYALMILSSASLMITGSFSIIYCILVIHDKLKIPAIAMLILGVCNIPLSILLSGLFDIFGILISSLIVNIAGYAVFLPLYFYKSLKFKIIKIYPAFSAGLLIIFTGAVSSVIIKTFFVIDGFYKLFISLFIVTALMALVIFIKIFDKSDIAFIKDIIKTKLEYSKELNEEQSSFM